MMKTCPCGSGIDYTACCEPIILGKEPAKTAEALMRSRYTAYVVKNPKYLGDSLHPDHRSDWDEESTRKWANEAEWHSLQIVSTDKGQENDLFGVVEFIAKYKDKTGAKQHHEISRFEKKGSNWFYVDGQAPKVETFRHDKPKVGRNDPCPCGSGKKYKKCCGKT